MNAKKQKAKDRRRARVLAEQAWEAANQGNLDLAEKIIRRAVDAQSDNPVLWDDQGCILSLREKPFEAVDAFHAKAIALGATDEGAPGERGPGFYMAYFRDLEGNKFCACRMG